MNILDRKSPLIINHEAPATNEKDYHTIHQGKATNTLVKFKTKISDPAQLNIYGVGVIEEKDFKLSIEKYSELTNGIKPTAKILLDALIITATESGKNNTEVLLPLAEYMKMRGLRDVKSARKQVKNDLEALFRISLSFSETRRHKKESYVDMRICSTKGIVKGVIVCNFNQDFYKLIKGYPVMPYPKEIFTFNPKYNPNSVNLLRRIAEHKNMNFNKTNGDIIGVKTLMKACFALPNYNDLGEAKQVNARIIEPFERDMNAIKSFKWEYSGKNGKATTPFTYEEFIQANIKVIWEKYPPRKTKRRTSKKQTEEK